MNEEIKEMLHCIEMNCKHNKCFGGVKLDEEDCKLLLNYITNLQQENKRLKCIDDSNRCLRSANDTLNERCHSYRIFYEDYKSRCEKAIELYKKCKEEDYCILSIKMYEILNGSDENE